MSLSLRQKSTLYRELGQLLRAGTPFPAAAQLLHGATSGSVRNFLVQLRASVDAGKSVDEAFAAQHPLVSHLEISIIGASARSGKLDQGCFFLSGYFEQLWTARKFVLGKMAYPLFILIVGLLVTGLPALVINMSVGGAAASNAVAIYLKGSVGTLVLLCLIAFVLWMVVLMLVRQGSTQPAMDRFLRWVPIVGKLRRAYALARFCTTYEMQLQSGVNVMDSLASAGRASQSGLINAIVRRALPLVRGGAQVGPLLVGDAFTEEMVRAIQIGEQTGELDAELKRLAAQYQQEAASRLEFAAAFLSKGIYIMILIYISIRLVLGYVGYLDAAMHSMDNF